MWNLETPADVLRIEDRLAELGTLEIAVKNNGFFAASSGADTTSGYQNTWLRDTVMTANFFRETGRAPVAAKTLKTLANYFCLHRERFEDIIATPRLRFERGRRPHVRFDGDTLRELPTGWAHAQNDSLGYALWLPFAMANAGQYEPDEFDRRAYTVFPAYFEAVEYWQDADSGHWEEELMVHNSSVGVVAGAMREMRRYLDAHPDFAPGLATQIDALIARGRERLQTLPCESPPERLADAATLFLIYPMQAVDEEEADAILELVAAQLQGKHGIRRYLGDSYWCQDYKRLLPPGERTADFSQRIEERNRLLKPGMEAQWCIFDPVISVIYGRRYLQSGRERDLKLQKLHLRRALDQLTPDGRCPELYYVADSSKGDWVPNDHVPLAWAQANLGVALRYMRLSAARDRA